MATNGANKVIICGGDVVEDTETTVEIKIKTLDSQTYSLRVDKCVPVPALKEQIATVTGVLSEQQRLICRGKILKDDQLLSAYHVEDGHTLHLVLRQPHHSSLSPSTSYMGYEGASDHPATDSNLDSANNRGDQVSPNYVFETVNMEQGDIDTSVISRIISSILDSIGTISSGTGNTRIDLREMGSERIVRPMGESVPSDSTQPQPNPTAPRVELDRPQAAFRFSSAVPLGTQNPTVIPDSLTTLHQYLGVMRDEFRREGSGANGREHIQDHGSESHLSSIQNGLPNPASLAEIVLSSRQLLVEHAGERLTQLARQLEDHTSVTDPLSRVNIQSSAMRSGVFLQNLGSLLLELGRTTMTLRMGQRPSEAVVNAGPAVFISASGPNPMMVQPVPFFPGSNLGGIRMGTINSGQGVEGDPLDSALPPRNIEVRIRTVGRAVPVAAANAGEQAGAQQSQEQMDPMRNSSGPNVVNLSGGGSLTGEPGVRVMPFRTVLAVPAGANHSPSDSSGTAVGLIYPLLARVRRLSTVNNINGARVSQASSEHHQAGPEVDQQPIIESVVQSQNLESNSGGPITEDQFPADAVPSANESAENQGQQIPPYSTSESSTPALDGQQIGQVPVAQLLSRFDQFLNTIFPGEQANASGIGHQNSIPASATATQSQEAPVTGNDQGVLFSSMLRQVMPLISQGTAMEPSASPTSPSSSTPQTQRENLNGSSSSRYCRDPSDAPSPKRPKREG